MPKYVGMSLSVVGALVLGETAVSAGFLSTPAIIIVAFSGICLYTVPNFVETVKGYSDYEQETLQGVIEARSAVQKANGAEEQAAASAQLDSAIDIWVNAVTEAYPDLKASAQYIALQDELAGTENRIATARIDYNEAVTAYNRKIRRFPSSITAALFGFEKAELFEAADDAQTTPSVSFD